MIYLNSKYLVCIFLNKFPDRKNIPGSNATLLTRFFSLWVIISSTEALWGFLGKTKSKAYTKLTVIICCQIDDRKSVALSSGKFWWGPPFGEDHEF